jgi:archaellum component FlaF (FlaF/FlaG flagellin family)
MIRKLFSNLAFILTALCLPQAAAAQNGMLAPGSLIVYPLIDNSGTSQTWVTVTNTNLSSASGTVRVNFAYINGSDCGELSRSKLLTPGDTLTVNTKLDNPNMTAGYLYVYATTATSSAAISFNHLIGTTRVINTATTTDMEYQPFVFPAIGAQGALTDLDNDTRRDLNNVEYAAVPNQLHFPRFTGHYESLGAVGFTRTSYLVLVSLAGKQFTSSVDFAIYNDNEEAFSAQTSFTCWTKRKLKDISTAFTHNFLLTTNHNASESFSSRETGTFRINGRQATSTGGSIADPAILALLIEEISTVGGDAVLPFAIGTQTNGDLLNMGSLPDTN